MMSKITEIFILKVKNQVRMDTIREKAREDFTALEGVTSWDTYVTTDTNKPTLYAEIFVFQDYKTAVAVTSQFAQRELTKAFLAEVDEVVVGQFFTQYLPKGR